MNEKVIKDEVVKRVMLGNYSIRLRKDGSLDIVNVDGVMSIEPHSSNRIVIKSK